MWHTRTILLLVGAAFLMGRFDIAAAGADFQLHPALTMTLYASEPDVVDPVALTWDEEGTLYVVEMRDYPYGFGPDRRPGGTIKLLRDRDGDGRVDYASLFATNLSFPTAVAPWNGGILVAAPPEIVFLKDTNGDDKAEVREVLFSGFTLGVTDSNMNGLRWGIDNRVHGVNGGNGGKIISSRKVGPPVPIKNLDFSFDPGRGDFAPTYHTSGGFGLVFDDWGRSFVTYNINHIQQRIIPVRYLERFPGMPPISAVESISDHGEMSRIYPISEPETRVNHPEQSGHFSSAGGMGLIGSPAYAGDLRGSILVCDVVGNLVHRDVLTPRGPVFVAIRSPAETNSEFFASRDRAFRPVSIEMGPDDALYLLDMQRDVIEHPDYIPEKVRNKLDLRAGENRGRIYRITPRAGLPVRKPSLRRATPAQLVAHLKNPNPWWRVTAQRLLVERRNEAGWTDSAVASLVTLAESDASSLGRLHALWTLRGLGRLEPKLILRALSAAESGIRENALVLAESHLVTSEELRQRVVAMADDPDARVRYQAALTLGEFQHPDVTAALLKILQRDHAYRWTRVAALSSVRTNEDRLLGAVLKGNLNGQAETKLELIRELADLAGARAVDGGHRVSAVITMASEAPESTRVALLEGFAAGLERMAGRIPAGEQTEVTAAIERLSRSASPALVAAVWKISTSLGLPPNEAQRRAITDAITRASDSAQPPANRVEAIQLLALADYAVAREPLFGLLDGRELAVVQLAALEALRRFDHVEVATNLITAFRELAPAARSAALNLLLQRLAFHRPLIEALETGRLTVGELNLDLEQRRRLLWESTPGLRERAAGLIGDGEYANRKTIVEEWLQKLPATGEAARGRVVFEKTCAQCHTLSGIGHAVGPDLGALAHRSVEDLLSNILDPNMAINPAYVSYTIETVSGEIESGILKSESADAVEMLQAFGRRLVIPRKAINRLQSSGISPMPEGLETGLTPQDLRDLLAFLQQKS